MVGMVGSRKLGGGGTGGCPMSELHCRSEDLQSRCQLYLRHWKSQTPICVWDWEGWGVESPGECFWKGLEWEVGNFAKLS